MPQLQSSLTTAGLQIPLVNQTQLGKAAGLAMHFADMTALLAAVGTDSPAAGERGNIANNQGIWRAGQPFTVATEPPGVRRTWTIGASAALSHARNVLLPSGVSVVLAADSNTVIATSGAPDSGVGAVGDLAVDFAGNARYLKTGASTWSASTGVFPGGTISVGGVPGWAASTAYSVGQRAVHASGRPIICHTAHTSQSYFDAELWEFPSDDGTTLFDFTQLPDGDVSTVHPIKGRLFNRFVESANWGRLVVKDGLFGTPTTGTPNPSTDNFYFEGALPSSLYAVQHIWAVLDVATSPAESGSITFLLVAPGVDTNAGVQAGVHSGLFLNHTNGQFSWRFEPYPSNLGPTQGPAWSRAVANGVDLRGKTIRVDIAVDVVTGQMIGLIDGVIVMQHTDATIGDYIRHTAALQFPGQIYKCREFGMSPRFPHWLNSRVSGLTNGGRESGYSSLLGTALTDTYQNLYEFKVAYGAGGAVEIVVPVFCQVTSGYIEMDIGTTTTPNDQTFGYATKIAGPGIDSLLTPSYVRYGTPGEVETVRVWIRKTSGGTAQLRSNTYGSLSGPLWRQVNVGAAL